MNANKRMKYASTPTYGMQKRGFSKKPQAAQPAPMPDFPAPPMQGSGAIPFAQPPFSPFPPAAFPQVGSSPPAPAFPPPPAGIASMTPPMTGAGFPPSQAAIQPPMMPPPLGNAVFQPPSQEGFAPRQQGFIPPMASQPMRQNNVIPAGFPRSAPEPMIPSPFSPAAPIGVQPYAGMATPPFMPQPVPFSPSPLPPSQGAPLMRFPSPAPGQPAEIAPPPLSYPGVSPKPATPKAFSPDQLWTVFLFGLLPLLFVSCLFVPSALDFLRYGFIVLCVVVLGAMWYRQMFTSSTRTTISIIYTALCIVVLSLLLNGNSDVKEANGGMLGMYAETQTTAPPSGAYAPEPTDVAPQDTPYPSETNVISEAELRLTEFMNIWSVTRESSEMVALVQPSWANSKENPTAELFHLLQNRTPVSYTIEEVGGTDADTSRTVTMSAYIDKNNNREPVRLRFMIIMVKEGADWYVDPNSLATNDVIQEEGSAEATQGLQTAQPRMTQTPMPDPGTLLYYNPSGGNFYHADPECPRVDSKYLPLQGSFPYSDLKLYLGKYEPCLECRAPTQAMSE